MDPNCLQEPGALGLAAWPSNIPFIGCAELILAKFYDLVVQRIEQWISKSLIQVRILSGLPFEVGRLLRQPPCTWVRAGGIVMPSLPNHNDDDVLGRDVITITSVGKVRPISSSIFKRYQLTQGRGRSLVPT